MRKTLAKNGKTKEREIFFPFFYQINCNGRHAFFFLAILFPLPCPAMLLLLYNIDKKREKLLDVTAERLPWHLMSATHLRPSPQDPITTCSGSMGTQQSLIPSPIFLVSIHFRSRQGAIHDTSTSTPRDPAKNTPISSRYFSLLLILSKRPSQQTQHLVCSTKTGSTDATAPYRLSSRKWGIGSMDTLILSKGNTSSAQISS